MKNERFLRCFANLGDRWDLTNDVINSLEEYVCRLFGSKKNDVDAACFEMFQKKYAKESRAIDLSTLPPCHSSLL